MTGVDPAAYVPRLLAERAAGAPAAWELPGTCVLVDISGFTSLSEQLARRGAQGTEDLIATLADVFAALLTASDDGGDVVKFAGDALMVLYAGEGHERRACHAAYAMRAELDRVGRVRLAGARARLRMSVGIHTGDWAFRLTGTRHLNLLVTGPATDRLLALQDAAEPGQVLVGPETAGALAPEDVAPVDGVTHGVELVRQPAAPPPPAPGEADASTDAMDVTSLLPRAFGERPDLLGADSEHRRAAMAFLAVTLPPALPEAVVGVAVDALTRTVEAACEETGATLLDTDLAPGGFRYFLTAGAPVAREDPEGRLLRTLLRVLGTSSPFTLRAGLAAGQVFAGTVGAPFRRTYSVMGDPTNLAARLAARADPGTVLAEHQAAQRSRLDLVTHEPAPVLLKGKAEPVRVLAVTGARGRRERATVTTPFVGRGAELDVVRAAATRARDGTGSVVEVVGEPGLGKSRLAHEALAEAALPVVTTAFDPYGAQVPFRASALLLRGICGIGPDAPPEDAGRQLTDLVTGTVPGLVGWLPLVAAATGARVPSTPEVDALDARFRTARTAAVVRDLLTVLLPGPTALLLDDTQWVDVASAELLQAVLREVGDRPWLVVLTRREGEVGMRGGDALPVERIDLPPLEPGTASGLVRATTDRPLLPHDVEQLVDRAAGNPLFLLELVQAGPTAGTELPQTVEEVVASRVDALPARDRDLLRRTAVWGSRVPAALLAALAEPGDDLARLDGFVDLTGEGEAVFRREVYREVAYAQLTFRRRRELHRRAAAVIEEQPGVAGTARLAMLALHHFAAADWAAAHAASARAAAEASEQDAPEAAAELSRRAVLAGQRAGLALEALRPSYVRLAESLFVTGRYAEAARAYATARRGVADPAQVTALTYQLGMVRREEGRFAAALAAARRAREAARSLTGDQAREWAAEIDLLEAGVRYWQGRSGDCLALSRRAAEAADGLPEGATRTRLVARAYALHDTAAVEIDGVSGEYGDEPLRMFEEIGDLYNQTRFAVNVGYGLFYAGDWDGAVARWRLSLDIARRIGDVSNVAVNEMNIGELLSYQGQVDEARELLRGAISTLVALGTPLPAAYGACFLGVAETLAGDWAAADEAFAESARLFVEADRHDGFSLDELTTRRLELLQARGASVEALAGADELLGRSQPAAGVHRVRAARTRALALAATGDAAGALAAIEQSAAEAADMGASFDRALTLLVLARLRDDPVGRQEAEGMLTALGVVDLALVDPLPPDGGG